MESKEDVGYLLARVENVERDMNSIKTEISAHMKDEERYRKEDSIERDKARRELHTKLDDIKNDLNIYRALWMLLKTFALALIATIVYWFDNILTFFKG
jgi:hypothetical protein